MKLTGIVSWAHVTKPKPASKHKGGIIPSVYAVDMILEKEAAKKLKKEGFNVKQIKDDIKGIEDAVGKYKLTIKKPAEYEGNPTTPPTVVDAQLKPFTGLIGNGSKLTVVFATKEWEGFGTTGTAAKLRKVQVLDLVPYESDEDLEDFESVDGFSSGESSKEVKIESDDEDDLDF